MTAPAPTRAEEAREAGQTAYEARFADARPREMVPWVDQPDDVKAVWARVEIASAARAEAEVARLTAENQRLRIAFHDATRRPLGVTPDSGAEFYDQRMADEAEERRRAGYPQEVITRIGRAEAAARAALHGGENDR